LKKYDAITKTLASEIKVAPANKKPIFQLYVSDYKSNVAGNLFGKDGDIERTYKDRTTRIKGS